MSRSNTESASPHWIEWFTGIVSALLVVALLAAIGWDILRYRPDEPAFRLKAVSVEPVEDRYRVRFTVHNTSMATAAKVHVRGTLSGESADVMFDYVAAESGEKGTLFFRGDPLAGGLDLAVIGYVEP